MFRIGAYIIQQSSNQHQNSKFKTRLAGHHLDVSANTLEDQNHHIPMPKDACENPARDWVTIEVNQALPHAAVLRWEMRS